MKPRERVLATMRRRQPDCVPYYLELTPPMQTIFEEKTGATDPAEYWNFDMRRVAFDTPAQATDYSVFFLEGLPDGTQINEWGVAEAPGSMHHFVRMIHPLQGAETIESMVDYPLPDFTRPECWWRLQSQVARFHARDLAVLGALEITIFEISWYIRGMENLLSDMMLEPDRAEVLLERITMLRVFQARTFAQAGVDILCLGDDVATQRGMLMSPRLWRTWLKPRLARVIDAARSANPNILIWYHTDGDCRAIIPELIEIGVDILNPVQPECMDPTEIKVLYGDRLSFSGTIGTQTTMPYGTPQEVKVVVQERIATMGRGGGLMLAPSHVLEPDVPWENVLAFIKTAQECH
jgi:uroporphyrinogen decarboxylase